MTVDPLLDEGRLRAALAAAELRPLARAVAGLADVDWDSPAAVAYRQVVLRLAVRVVGVCAALDEHGGR